MVWFVRGDLNTHREAFNTEIKIWTFITLDSDGPWDVFVAVVAMIKSLLCFWGTYNSPMHPAQIELMVTTFLSNSFDQKLVSVIF